MAVPWIKMRKDLHGDPAVIAIASATGLDADSVVGKLHRLWSWADSHTTNGIANGVSAEWVDTLVSCQTFAKSMTKVGWLALTKRGLSIPNFERHNGETAKQRALTQIRMKKKRDGDIVTEASPDKTRQDKTRQESLIASNIAPTSNGEALSDAASAVADAMKDFAWEDIRTDCRKVSEVVKCSTPQDYDLIAKVCFLSRTALNENWLWGAVESVAKKSPDNPPGYFNNALKNRCKEMGHELNFLLRQIAVPKGFINGT